MPNAFQTTITITAVTYEPNQIEAVLQALINAGYILIARSAPPQPNEDRSFAGTWTFGFPVEIPAIEEQGASNEDLGADEGAALKE